MDNTMTPRLGELVRELRDALRSYVIELRDAPSVGSSRPFHYQCKLCDFYWYPNDPEVHSENCLARLSRLMAEGGLVGAASPAASLEEEESQMRELLARECDKVLLHGMAKQVREYTNFSDHLPGAALAAMRRWGLLQRSEATGSPPNPVDDGAVERAFVRIKGAVEGISPPYTEQRRLGYEWMRERVLDEIEKVRKAALEAAEPHP